MALQRHPPPWWQDGLLRLSPGQDLTERLRLAETQRLDPRFAQALDAEAASRAAGLDLDAGGWLFPGGGALPPREWVLKLLAGLPLPNGKTGGLQERCDVLHRTPGAFPQDRMGFAADFVHQVQSPVRKDEVGAGSRPFSSNVSR